MVKVPEHDSISKRIQGINDQNDGRMTFLTLKRTGRK